MKKQDDQIEIYLKEACRWIFFKKERKSVQLELRSHIEDSIQEKRERGVEPALAIESALKEMGPVKKLSVELGFAHRPFIFRWPFVSAAFVGAFVVSFISLLAMTSYYFHGASKNQDKTVKIYLGRFLEDEKILSDLPQFDFSGRGNDAGPFLNPKVVWSGVTHNEFTRFFPDVPKLNLEKGVQEKLQGPQWLDANLDVSRIDTRRMSELSHFDHWNIFDSGPVDQIFVAKPSQNFWSLPTPDYRVLQAWAKIRMLQGLKSGRPIKAFGEAHNLSRLIYSNQLLVSSMVYVALLSAEKQAAELAQKKRIIGSSSWDTLSGDQITRARRALFAFPGLFDLWTDPATLATVLGGETAKAGMCSAIQEKMSGMGLSRLFYEDNPFYSEEFNARFSRIGKVITGAQSHCIISKHFINLWTHPELAAPWISPEYLTLSEADRFEKFKWLVLARVPIVKTWLGAKLDKVGHPNYMAGPYAKYLLAGEKKLEN